MNYIILTSWNSVSELTENVREAIEDGWQPIGGVSFSVNDNKTRCAQAMILIENQKEM